MEKILITGANGFIGSHLTDFLVAKEYDVFGIDIPNRPFIRLSHYTDGKKEFSKDEKIEIFGDKIQILTNNEKLTLLECDINDVPLLEKIIKTIKPKYIFHFAAQPLIKPSWEDPVNTIRINVIGTINVFEIIKKHDIKTRVIFTCTAAEFGTTASSVNRPLKEDDPLLAVHPYGISKIAAELLARQYYINFGIEAVNVRFFSQTGPRQVNVAPSDFISKVAKIELGLMDPVIEVGNLNPYRDFTGIKDTLQALWLAATKGRPGETYHVCSNKKTQISEILKIALSFSSKKIEVKENISEKLRVSDEDIMIGDNSKIINELGFKITQSINDILKDMYDYWLDYYRSHDK